MHVIKTEIPDVLIIEPKFFGDDRGFFYESYNEKDLFEMAGIKDHFVQDNHSFSQQGVLRGLHYQLNKPQGKLVRVVMGDVFDVAVDLRKSSNTFGKWVGVRLSSENHRMLWIPKGFAHGFLVLSKEAHFLYKASDYYDPSSEKTLHWNDPTLSIAWPKDFLPQLSKKDQEGVFLHQAQVYS